ncbi:MAG TPA: hypothetical protein HPP59_07060, partial [Deltaproteobacteria bacterium]|nr:hypothetical protein [Deltaproteobacteria bacterium]
MRIPNRSFQTVKIFILGLAIIFTAGVVGAEQIKITEEEVVEAQKDWGDALVSLGKTYSDGQNYRQAAESLVDRLYAYQTGQVLF